MASYWKHVYFRETLKRDSDENFKNASDEVSQSAFLNIKNMLNTLEQEEIVGKTENRKCDSFDLVLTVFAANLNYILTHSAVKEGDPVVSNRLKMAENYVDSLLKSGRIIFLSGEWMLIDSAKKNDVQNQLSQIITQVPSRKDPLLSLLCLSREPWSTPSIKQLINGRMEKEEDVLGLLSGEGVEGVLLRIEMLVEGSLQAQALKAASAVLTSLLTEDMIMQSYSSTSPHSTIERLVDIFIALSAGLNKLSRLYKVLKMLGLEDVNNVYMKRFSHYLNNTTHTDTSPPPTQQDKDVEPKDSNDVDMKDADSKENSQEKTSDDSEKLKEDDAIDDSRFQLLEKGRCARLLTSEVALKALEIIFQWSLAGVAVKPTSDHMHTHLISEWIENCSRNKERFMEDVEILADSATQTPFIYSLAHQLHKRFGVEVEERVLGMFVKALLCDINDGEDSKRSKYTKAVRATRLARGFWLLSEVVSDRMTLCRECVLTSFSIKPTQVALDRMLELATLSGVNQTEEVSGDEEEGADGEGEIVPPKSGLHCRVTADGGGAEKKTQFLKAYHQALKVQKQTRPLSQLFGTFKQSADKLDECLETFLSQLQDKSFQVAPTKLRTKKVKKKVRNLEGLISIRGELVTEAANYNPLEVPCRSLQPDSLKLPPKLTSDLLIVISAPRWHMLSWVMSWPELKQACADLLKDPTMKEPIEELKYLNIDYTQFNGWSSDEEVTIFTGIEKGFEQWILEGPESKDDKVSEDGASSDDDEPDHSIAFEDYDDTDKYQVPEDYFLLTKPQADEAKEEEKEKEGGEQKMDTSTEKSTKEKDEPSGKDKKPPRGEKRKASPFPETVQDEFCALSPESPSKPVPALKS